jgi:hypothetical protein
MEELPTGRFGRTCLVLPEKQCQRSVKRESQKSIIGCYDYGEETTQCHYSKFTTILATHGMR